MIGSGVVAADRLVAPRAGEHRLPVCKLCV